MSVSRASVLPGLLWTPLCASLAAALGVLLVLGTCRPDLPSAAGMAVLFLGAAAAGSMVAGALVLLLGLVDIEFWTNYARMARITAALALVSGFGMHFYERLTADLRDARAQLREKELAEARARSQALEAKLSSLESRLHPHVLFNTLNSLSALISSDPARAETMVGRLAALLRNSLSLGGRHVIALEEEMAIVRDYLCIERERLGERLEYRLDTPADAGACLVPPFSVQSLVETSVKHGIGSGEGVGRVDVAASRRDGMLQVEVRDSGPGFDLSGVAAEHGLDNLIARLETIFGLDAGLEVHRRGGGCVVTLRVPVRTQTAAAGA